MDRGDIDGLGMACGSIMPTEVTSINTHRPACPLGRGRSTAPEDQSTCRSHREPTRQTPYRPQPPHQPQLNADLRRPRLTTHYCIGVSDHYGRTVRRTRHIPTLYTCRQVMRSRNLCQVGLLAIESYTTEVRPQCQDVDQSPYSAHSRPKVSKFPKCFQFACLFHRQMIELPDRVALRPQQ